METLNRKPLQGVANIIRFNWHFYAIAFSLVFTLFFVKKYFSFYLNTISTLAIIFTITTTFISLAVSYYIYDFSDLYSLKWIDFLQIKPESTIVNINAGFDETSIILKEKYPNTNLKVFDFYDSKKHTEISIERARKVYPTFPNTQNINTEKIPMEENSVDYIFLIFAAHEIRNPEERVLFFKQLHNIIKPIGKIIVVEHQRDMNNFIAYTIGFLHFYSNKTWKAIFKCANLSIESEFKITPFITTFILQKNGITS